MTSDDSPAALQQRLENLEEQLRQAQKMSPIGAIASGAMLLRHSLGLAAEADAIDRAIGDTLVAGPRTADLVIEEAQTQIGGAAMAQQVLDRLES